MKTMFKAIALLTLAFLVGGLSAAEPKGAGLYWACDNDLKETLPGMADLSVPAFKQVTLTAPKDIDPSAGLDWRVSPSMNVSFSSQKDEKVCEFVAPPGIYDVELLAVTQTVGTDGKAKTSIKRYNVKVEILPPVGAPPPKKPDDPKPGAAKPDAPKAIARITFAPYGCTATPIWPRRDDGKWDVLTAAHCVSHVKVGSTGTMKMLDGRSFTVRVAAVNAQADVCWMTTEEVVADLPYAVLAADVPAAGTKIWHAGYGVDKPGNREEGEVLGGEDGNGQIRMSLSVSSGDSGGGIFRVDSNELVSVVCCTSAKGFKTNVWGGSCKSAAKYRPTKSKTSEWDPIAIPEVLPLR